LSKQKLSYRCNECGAISLRWQGRCPECGAWNSYAKEEVRDKVSRGVASSGESPMLLSKVPTDEAVRFETGSVELDRVLGGGLVPGSLVLLGGDPGIGKSTLLLQAASHVARNGKKVLYASAEESSGQIGLRAARLGIDCERLLVMANNDVEEIERAIKNFTPELLIADSIQTLYLPSLPGAPGTVSQVRQCASRFMNLAKMKNITTFLVGHVTKEGSLAGPRVLEHMVDTVLYFEGERFHSFRVLRATKNRFGSTNEIGVFEMNETGLDDVDDLSRFFIEEHSEPVSGSILVATQEGSRTVVVEVQALVSTSFFPTPQRVCTGIDRQRLTILLAVLEQRAGLPTSGKDVFVNVVGGVRLVEPASDLGVALAVASAISDMPIGEGIVAAGEIGLAGEIRRVNHLSRRLNEATKLGLKRFIQPAGNKEECDSTGIETVGVENIAQAIARVRMNPSE